MDWKDALAISCCYVLLILAASSFALPEEVVSALAIICLAAPFFVRRAIWGRPALLTPRTGFWYSAASVCGGLLMFLGMGTAVAGTWGLITRRSSSFEISLVGGVMIALASALMSLRYPRIPSARVRASHGR
jgi:hypothetical protein